ncbi:Ubiquitin system component Cue [Sesbania bispinosa]|nr:Ubiquitin system component Cue [Sesbania bispinosa]
MLFINPCRCKSYDQMTPQHTTQDQQLIESSTRRPSTAEAFPVKSQSASSSYTSPSQNVTELTNKQLADEELDIDMEYLRMAFPGISDQSLLDVYNVNNGDLDAAIDMLSQLEFDGCDLSGSLPDTLDIGDVPESELSADFGSSKPKNVASEASTSDSHKAS